MLVPAQDSRVLLSREMTVKFNDYFEFPREFDMAPYTAATLAKLEGESASVHLPYLSYT